MEDIVMVGGGASALMCAIANNGKSNITIIERNDKIGQKILVTGNGRCNLTNINLDVNKYNDEKVKEYFDVFNEKDTINFFHDLGLETYRDREGRVYPVSNSANSVLDVLRLKLNSLKTKIICNFDLVNIKKLSNGYKLISRDKKELTAKKLVIATGGNTSCQLLKDLNVDYKKYSRSLGAIKTDKNKGLNGVKVQNVKVSLKYSGQEKTDYGELLFKENAISGIVVFNLSTMVARKNIEQSKVVIDFLPNVSSQELMQKLIKQKDLRKSYTIEDFLTGFFHKALNLNILSRCNINLNNKVDELTDAQLSNICNMIKNYSINTQEICENNQVYSGGIGLSDLDENLNYKDENTLYFIGESVDVDGECGGYNLQWAWTSGYIVGVNL